VQPSSPAADTHPHIDTSTQSHTHTHTHTGRATLKTNIWKSEREYVYEKKTPDRQEGPTSKSSTLDPKAEKPLTHIQKRNKHCSKKEGK